MYFKIALTGLTWGRKTYGGGQSEGSGVLHKGFREVIITHVIWISWMFLSVSLVRIDHVMSTTVILCEEEN